MSLIDGILKKEADIKEAIDVSGISLARLIGSAKKIRSENKKVVTYTDKLSTEEATLFKNDYYLAGLVLEKKALDKQITEHIDRVVSLFRHQQQLKAEAEKTIEVAK
ncbi:MAG: hypothetical protein AMQ22_00044 [Candidatus Methanofastidiosum methylothiophilum]|uniref:Uncharacterized protein n=1 Tax=Candidatus Methanofastidiosum methylothiophilum TaxID=1705564 RepID=A0A150J9M9_9EURY|nr:MAG: hypothetical protein AMQ22_00044 [Candidatus Methanofastidiosum methylthiophilus]